MVLSSSSMEKKEEGLWIWQTLTQIQTRSLTRGVILGKLLNISEPQLFIYKMGIIIPKKFTLRYPG